MKRSITITLFVLLILCIPNLVQAKLGDKPDIYYGDDNPKTEEITITTDHSRDKPLKLPGYLGNYFKAYSFKDEVGDWDYQIEGIKNQEGSIYSVRNGQIITVHLSEGKEQGAFEIVVNTKETGEVKPEEIQAEAIKEDEKKPEIILAESSITEDDLKKEEELKEEKKEEIDAGILPGEEERMNLEKDIIDKNTKEENSINDKNTKGEKELTKNETRSDAELEEEDEEIYTEEEEKTNSEVKEEDKDLENVKEGDNIEEKLNETEITEEEAYVYTEDVNSSEIVEAEGSNKNDTPGWLIVLTAIAIVLLIPSLIFWKKSKGAISKHA